jgi:peptidoglycan/xylan/chitin deacetylase (PgdA/CDA1 family)
MRLFGWAALIWLTAVGAVHATDVPVLAYHDITERHGADEFAVPPKEFRRHMQYLRDQGYTPISLQQLINAGNAQEKLPDKPVLLTFDDGLDSYEKTALPVLLEYGYPSVLSIVTAWVDGRATPEQYRERLLNWNDLRRISKSPLVEIISHSDNLHQGIRSNPQGNLAPATVTRVYREGSGRYESEKEFRARIHADLARSRARMLAELGRAPLAITWPFGDYDRVLVDEATQLGMRYYLTLNDTPTTLENLPCINRSTFRRYRNLQDLDDMLTFRDVRNRQFRYVEITLDRFAGKSAAEQEQLLSALLARLELLRVNSVVVSPFSSDQRRAFFPNLRMPVVADLLNRVLHQIRARIRIERQFLMLPATLGTASARDVYTELARLNRFDGVMFTGDTTDAGIGQLSAIFRYYNPAIRVGVPFGSSVRSGADFYFKRFDTGLSGGVIERQTAAALQVSQPVYFILDRAERESDDELLRAMRALRAGGARHYGYSNDDFLGNVPKVLRIVPELQAFAVRSAGK